MAESRKVREYELHMSDCPGICSQEDFDHDVNAVMWYIECLNLLIADHDYSVHLSKKQIGELQKFSERVAHDRFYHGLR